MITSIFRALCFLKWWPFFDGMYATVRKIIFFYLVIGLEHKRRPCKMCNSVWQKLGHTKPQVKLRVSKKATKVWKNFPLTFDIYLVTSKLRGRLILNFVAFSEYINFTNTSDRSFCFLKSVNTASGSLTSDSLEQKKSACL